MKSFSLLVPSLMVLLGGFWAAMPSQTAESPGAKAGAISAEEMPSPAGPGSGEPNLFVANGRVYLSWLASAGDGQTTLLFSAWDGKNWASPKPIVSGKNLLVNWADFPSLIVLEDGTLAAHWLESSGGSRWYDYDVRVATSRDGGARWSPAVSPHRDGTKSEHGFVSLVPLRGNQWAAFWLDGRQKAGRDASPHEHKPSPKAQALYFAKYNGEAFEPEHLLDPRVCDCCQTAAVKTPSGLLVAYRDRSDAEVRDISYVRYHNGQWTAPKTLHPDGWVISGCPVNGPALASQDDTIAAAWFTMDGRKGHVYLSFSRDGGERFGLPVSIDEGQPLGRVDVKLLKDGSAVVSWLEARPGGAEILIRRVTPNGDRQQGVLVAKSSPARASGFLRMAYWSGELIFAWIDTREKPAHVRLARLNPTKVWP